MKSLLLFMSLLLIPSVCLGASNCGAEGASLWQENLQLRDGGRMSVELLCVGNCYQTSLELTGNEKIRGYAKTCGEDLDKGWSINFCGVELNQFDGTVSEVANKAKALCDFVQPGKNAESRQITGNESERPVSGPLPRSYPPRRNDRPAMKREIGLLAGSNAGTYIKFAQDIQRVTKDVINLRVDTGGSLVNINRLLNDKLAQFAIVQYDSLIYKKTYDDPQLDKKLRIILPLYNEEIHLIVNRNAGINSLSDLNGKKVNTDKENSGCWITSTIIKEAANVNWEEYHLPPVEGIKKVIDGELDAFIYVCGKPAPFLEILGEEAAEFIKLVPLEMDAIYPSTVIKAGTYPWMKEDVKTNATKALLVTWNYGENASQVRYGDYADGIRKMIAKVRENLDHLKADGHPKWKEVDLQDYKSLQWPLHYAAQEVLQEGQPDPEQEKKKQKLFQLLKEFQ